MEGLKIRVGDLLHNQDIWGKQFDMMFWKMEK
jgi:hypothetical protein